MSIKSLSLFNININNTRLCLSFAIMLIFGLLLCVGSTTTLKAQDAEFSQFYAAPTYLNPAMIGFSDQPRFILNYRHQYPGFGNAFMTLATSYDQHFDRYNSSIGVSLFADRTGTGGIYNTYGLNALYAYQLQLSQNLMLKAGFQVGYLNKTLEWDKVILGDMIDPATGRPTLPSADNAPATTSLHRFDLGAGALAYNESFYMGVAVKHITQPGLSFTDSGDDENYLPARMVFHVGKVFYLGQKNVHETQFYISPNLLYVNQGKFNQINAGLYVGKNVLQGGLWYRHTLKNSDALIALFSVKLGMFKVGYSFDMNLGSVGTSASTHEISLIFDMGDNPETRKAARNRRNVECPEIF